MFCHHQKMGDCWTLIDFDDTKTLILSLLIKLIKCFRDNMNIPFKQFTNEHLEQTLMFRFESLKTTLQNWSSSSKIKVSDLNHYTSDSNPNSNKFSLMKVIRIPHSRIWITILESANWRIWRQWFESLWEWFQSQF